MYSILVVVEPRSVNFNYQLVKETLQNFGEVAQVTVASWVLSKQAVIDRGLSCTKVFQALFACIDPGDRIAVFELGFDVRLRNSVAGEQKILDLL